MAEIQHKKRKLMPPHTHIQNILDSKYQMVPGGGFEPPQAICPPAPQAGASTYSAIPAIKRQYIVYRIKYNVFNV